jgi:hypothetical protein
MGKIKAKKLYQFPDYLYPPIPQNPKEGDEWGPIIENDIYIVSYDFETLFNRFSNIETATEWVWNRFQKYISERMGSDSIIKNAYKKSKITGRSNQELIMLANVKEAKELAVRCNGITMQIFYDGNSGPVANIMSEKEFGIGKYKFVEPYGWMTSPYTGPISRFSRIDSPVIPVYDDDDDEMPSCQEIDQFVSKSPVPDCWYDEIPQAPPGS